MENYAGRNDVDNELTTELETAGIEVLKYEFLRNASGEVKTSIRGGLHGWGFERAWYYWVAKGPGIPLKEAMELHKTHGKEVRVDGDCGCPTPLECFKGFGTGCYHIDTQEGLKALADTINKIVENAEKEY